MPSGDGFRLLFCSEGPEVPRVIGHRRERFVAVRASLRWHGVDVERDKVGWRAGWLVGGFIVVKIETQVHKNLNSYLGDLLPALRRENLGILPS
jgi:hypothetical protein